MALVKKTPAPATARKSEPVASAQVTQEAEAQRRRARTLAKQQQVSERIAAATGQLSAGIAESAAASEQLQSASDQIAVTAEEMSGATQEALAAFTQVNQAISRQLSNADNSRTRCEELTVIAASTASDIDSLVANVREAAKRQASSVDMVSELEKQAANIGDIVKAVVRIADQTNLLALNAAIEAARAGKHGKGFAVVADEVRTLAETSEQSANQIQALVRQIQQEVKSIAEGIKSSSETVQNEAEKGLEIRSQLSDISKRMETIVGAARDIANGASQSSIAGRQALKGMEDIASAAEEQSAAAEESAKTIGEQSQALSECERAAQDLNDLAEDLRNATDVSKSAEDVASSAEELSSAVQEINRASTQIMTAIEQIRLGAQTAAAATEESSAALTQIERGLEISQDRATTSLEQIATIKELLSVNKTAVDTLIHGIGASVETTQLSIRQVRDLETVSRRIDKIVEAITMVSIQTNMLAVNGSIEAARAGEFGKGFVVVATDIRNLARDSAENAEQIKDLVKGVQDQIITVSHDLDDIVKSAVDETEKAKLSTANLLRIENDIDSVETGAQDILNAAKDVSEAILQVKKGSESIASAAQEAEKAASEAATAAEQQSRGADELAQAIEEIASLADELQSM